MERYHIFVDGRVQGVGMRGFCVMQANKYNLTGSVKNLSNGLVEIYVQGEESNIDLFIDAIKEGNYFIRVTDISLKKVDIVSNEKSFKYI